MLEISVLDLARVCEGQPVNVSGKEFVSGVSTDSRNIEPGNLFVALKGENFDGHDFLGEAFEAGAAAALVSGKDMVPVNGPAVLVGDTLAALQKLAGWWRQKFPIPLVGVTGSSGKTTTKDILSSLVSVVTEVHSSSRNFNNEIGVPITLLGLNPRHQICVLEMGMRGPGEITHLCEIAQPTAGIITNVGNTHFERLGSVENIARAKGELAKGIPDEGFLMLNADNEWSPYIAKMTKAKVVCFGFSENAHIRASQVVFGREGSEFTMTAFGQSQRLRLPLWGEHNIYNSLAAAGAYIMLGLPRDSLQQGFNRVSVTKMRLEKVPGIKDSIIINDTYNANPSSMLASLKVLKQVGGSRSVAVLGDMFELGDIQVPEHRRVGAGVCELGVDLLVSVGNLAENISEEAMACGMPRERVFHAGDTEDAVKVLSQIIRAGDVVLVKGSRGMKMERIVDALRGDKHV